MSTQTRRWRNLLLAMLVAAFCFGGTFVCKTSTHDDDFNNDGAAGRSSKSR